MGLRLMLLLCACLGTDTAQAASPGVVLQWGDVSGGQGTVPVAAQSGVTAIAAGSWHTAALKTDGSVLTWGDTGPVPPAAQSGVVTVAAGGYHTVALKIDGSVVAWLVDSDYNHGQTAVAQSGVVAIAAGAFHTVVLKTDGSVVAWGWNNYGQTSVPTAAQSGVSAIAAGGNNTVALKYDGSLLVWGDNSYGQTNAPQGLSGVTAIAVGGHHIVALKNDGSVVAWGRNDFGQTNVPFAAQSGVAAIAAGGNSYGGGHTLALKNDGSVVAWGLNNHGQTTVPVAAQSAVLAIAAGAYHNVAIVIPAAAPTITTQPMSQTVNKWQNASFTVVAAGFAASYQWRKDGVDLAGATNATYTVTVTQTNQAGSYTVVVSNGAGSVTSAPPAVLTVNTLPPGAVVAWGSTGPVPVAAQSVVAAIAAGQSHTVALKNDGSVLAWGNNTSGQTTVPVAAQSGVIAIAAAGSSFGRGHTVALKNDGSVLAWGGNSDGQTAVPAAAQSGVIAIAAGASHTVALKNDGSVLAWGNNTSGQTTVPVAAQSGVIAIAAGASHTVALKNDGSVLAWGNNTSGQTTVPVAAQSGVIAIAAGGSHTVALKNDGTVVPWGNDDYDQTMVPTGLSGVTAIAAGSYHTVALLGNGTPTLSVQPTGRTVLDGDNPELVVMAMGQGMLSYQWLRDGTNVMAATNNRLPFVNVQPEHSGDYSVIVSNALGAVTSRVARLTVVIPTVPAIVSQPISQTATAWQSASFTVAATGYPLNYQWRKDGLDIAGATSATYTLPLVQANQAGSYTVAVSNRVGSVTSAPPAVLMVNAAPPGRVVAWGDNSYGQTNVPVATQYGVAAIAAGANHTVVLKFDGSMLAWGNNTSGQTTVPVAAQSGVIAIAAGGDHTVALKSDGSVLAWGANWIGQTMVPAAAQSGVIAIAAGGDHTVALKNGGTVVAWGENFYGQTTVPAGLTGVVALSAGSSHTEALKNDGSVVAWGYNYKGLTMVPVIAQSGVVAISAGDFHTVALVGDGTPALTLQPVNQTALLGNTVRLAAMVVGNGPLFYQWRLNGNEIVGATNALLELLNVQTNQAGAYAFVVTNALGAVTSRVAQVQVFVPARVLSVPPSTTVLLGSNVTLYANAGGTPPLIYQWRKNGANIPDATNSSYTITNVQVSDGGAYTVVVKNGYGVATSDPMLLIVEVPPQAPGDNFADRVPISSTNGVVGGTNRFATKEAGEPNHGGKAGGKSVWYTWPAPTNGIATFRTSGSVFDTLLGIYTGSTVTNLTTIASDEDRGGFFTSEVQFNALAGTDYHIAVDGFAGAEGEFILSWSLEITSDTLPVITNQPLSQAVLTNSDVMFSVAAGGDGLTYQWFFNDATIPGATTSNLTRNNVQPVDVGSYSVRVRNSVGREVESLAAALEIVSGGQALSQDKLGDLSPQGPGGLAGPHPPKGPAFFTVSLGTIDYQIVNNRHSRTEPTEPNPCGVIGGRSQAILLHAESNGMFRIDTIGSAIDTVLTVYRYTNSVYLTNAQVACDNDGAPDGRRSLLWFNATANADYLVIVDGVNYEKGTIHINWAFGLPPSAGTDSLPLRHTFLPGQSLTLRAPATNGIPPPHFQWYWNGSPIAGAANALFTLNNLQSANVGFYTVIVSNAIGMVTYSTDIGMEVTSMRAELKLTDKVLRLWLPSATNQTTIVETSTDLQHWAPVYLHSPQQNNFFDFSVTNSAQQFFRTRSITGP